MSDEVRAEFLQAGVEVAQGVVFRTRVGLGGEHDVLAFALESGADHPLVVAALVAAGGIEIGDPDIGGAFDDAAVRGDHTAEADRGDLEARLAQSSIAERGAGRRRFDAGVAGRSGPRNERRKTRQATPGRRREIGGERA